MKNTQNSIKKEGILRRMARAFDKWWLLMELRNECRNHVVRYPMNAVLSNAKASVERQALMIQAVKKSPNNLTSWMIFWKNVGEKNARRAHEYQSIFDECIREDLAFIEPANTLANGEGGFLNPPNRPFFRTTDLGDKYVSNFWWKVLFDNHYAKTIITALVVAWLGLWLTGTFSKVTTPPAVNVYPNIYVEPH